MSCNAVIILRIWIFLTTASGVTNGSEFKVSAVLDQTHLTVTCELLDSNLSTESVFLMDHNVFLEECRWAGTQYQCTIGAQVLPNERGVKFKIIYQSSMKLICGINDILVDVIMEEESTTEHLSSQSLARNVSTWNISNGQCSKTSFILVQVLTLNLICLILCHI